MSGTGRVEAFSDGVLAIIITIMVLEMKVPHGRDLAALGPLWPVFLSYVLSFVYLGIYWNNHHHLMRAASRVSGGVLWANLHLLFWLSLVPFVTGWMGENRFAPVPTALYGGVLLLAAVAYTLLQRIILAHEPRGSALRAAIGRDVKGKLSLAVYAAAVPLAFVHPAISGALYVAVAVLWLIPDARIERAVAVQEGGIDNGEHRGDDFGGPEACRRREEEESTDSQKSAARSVRLPVGWEADEGRVRHEASREYRVVRADAGDCLRSALTALRMPPCMTRAGDRGVRGVLHRVQRRAGLFNGPSSAQAARRFSVLPAHVARGWIERAWEHTGPWRRDPHLQPDPVPR
jgi:uncharacterized membrane protein